jgi:hypothetical protein
MEHRFTYPTVREVSRATTERPERSSQIPAQGKSQRELVMRSLLRLPERRSAGTPR